jgi:hypothetical protein
VAHHLDTAIPDPDRFDGAFRCHICPDHFPREDNDWCPIARAVVCDDCCRALMMGDERAADVVALRVGHDLDGDEIIDSCMRCDRLVRLVSETATEGESEGVRLPMH